MQNYQLYLNPKRLISLVIVILLFGMFSQIIFLNSDSLESKQKSNTQFTPRLVNSLQTLSLELIDPTNMSLITNGTEILYRLSGSHDNKIFYHWSFESNNDSFIVLDEYFIIEAPSLANVIILLLSTLYRLLNIIIFAMIIYIYMKKVIQTDLSWCFSRRL